MSIALSDSYTPLTCPCISCSILQNLIGLSWIYHFLFSIVRSFLLVHESIEIFISEIYSISKPPAFYILLDIF